MDPPPWRSIRATPSIGETAEAVAVLNLEVYIVIYRAIKMLSFFKCVIIAQYGTNCYLVDYSQNVVRATRIPINVTYKISKPRCHDHIFAGKSQPLLTPEIRRSVRKTPQWSTNSAEPTPFTPPFLNVSEPAIHNYIETLHQTIAHQRTRLAVRD